MHGARSVGKSRTWIGFTGFACLAAFTMAALVGCPGNPNSLNTVAGLVSLGPPPTDGQFVDVGGYRLFYKVAGEGEIPVILMSGEDENLRIWNQVFDDIADMTTVVAYDRGGVGWSDPGPNPRNGRMVVQELRNFLNAIELEGPYILAAHSLGGLFARLYAHTYPDDIAGILLIDTTHEDYWRRTALELGPRSVQTSLLLMGIGQSVITINQVGALGEYYNIPNIPDEVRANRTLPDVPLLLLSQDLVNFTVLDDDEEAAALFMFQEFYQDQSRLVRRGVWEPVQNTSHFIMVDQPQAVIDGVERVLAGW